jgi:hypothetical protein
MLEIYLLHHFVNASEGHTLRRKRKPGVFIAITLILMIGMEITGFIFGLILLKSAVCYPLGLGLALIGGVCAITIS